MPIISARLCDFVRVSRIHATGKANLSIAACAEQQKIFRLSFFTFYNQDCLVFLQNKEMKVRGEIRDKLKEIDIANITPLEALNILQFLKNKSDKFQ